MEHPSERDFTIGDVFSDAFASFKDRVGTHFGFNAVFVAGYIGVSCLFSCVIWILMFATGAALGNQSNPGAMVGVMGIGGLFVYGLLFLIMFAAMGTHHGFTLAVTVADRRNEAVDFSRGMNAVGPRILAHLGQIIVKMGIDWTMGCLLFGAIFGIVGFDTFRSAGPNPDPMAVFRIFGEFIALIGVAYILWIVWVIAVRGFVGLAACAVQVEGLGPIDGISRSVSLLSGRRMQFIGMRLIWGVAAFVLYLLLYVPLGALGFMNASGGDPNPLFVLIMLPYLAFFGFAMLMMYSFDSVLEGAYFARCVPTSSTTHVADVFV
jgi:hypothetical protein